MPALSRPDTVSRFMAIAENAAKGDANKKVAGYGRTDVEVYFYLEFIAALSSEGKQFKFLRGDIYAE